MKKYKIIIAILTMIYVVMAFSMNIIMNNIEDKLNNEYRVEINRLSLEIDDSGVLNSSNYNNNNRILTIGTDSFSDIENISSITYIFAGADNTELIDKFYTPANGYEFEIVPIIHNKDVMGYLRFDYTKSIDVSLYIVLSEIFLMLIYLISVGILIYTDQKILKPFNQLSNMPYELSKGNLNDSIDESKNRYFGRFLWGIGMLKDSLESHKNKELRLVRDKKMLLLSISHDIKTPLNAINLYAKALEQGIFETEEEKEEAIIKIQEKTVEIDDFVKEIIKSSTEDVVSIAVNDSEYYLSELIDKVISGYLGKCNLNKMTFEIGTYDNYLLKGDIDRMYEAIGNLIENAFKYGDGKRLDITFTEEDYCVLIHVYNSGLPLNDNEMPHLFESFYRGSNTDGKAGNGLGLYICSEIMKKMNGDIFARQAKEGMEFVLVCQLC